MARVIQTRRLIIFRICLFFVGMHAGHFTAACSAGAAIDQTPNWQFAHLHTFTIIYPFSLHLVAFGFITLSKDSFAFFRTNDYSCFEFGPSECAISSFLTVNARFLRVYVDPREVLVEVRVTCKRFKKRRGTSPWAAWGGGVYPPPATRKFSCK